MTDPAVTQGIETLMLRQVVTELVKSALPEGGGATAGAFQDLFATALAESVAEGQEARTR